MKRFKNFYIIILFVLLCLITTACDSNIPYENSSINGCYAMNDGLFNQFWFDGVSEFEEIYWTSISGSISYYGRYTVSQNKLYLEYYSYDPEMYELYLYSDGITIDDTWYPYAGQECM
jgi:hypothetical protein